MTVRRRLHIALSFLTCLGRGSLYTAEDISASMPMYPIIGAFLGGLLVLPLWWASPQADAWILAWLALGFYLVLTRALHWDAWADLWDGWGSGARGERFWSIVKDSHIGAFGALGLVLGLGLYAASLHVLIVKQAWAALVLACMNGRLCCLVLAWLGRSLVRPGLGRNALLGATRSALIWNGMALLCLGIIFLGPLHVLTAASLAGMGLLFVLRLAQREQGLNGDFLGAAIIWGELAALLPLGWGNWL